MEYSRFNLILCSLLIYPLYYTYVISQQQTHMLNVIVCIQHGGRYPEKMKNIPYRYLYFSRISKYIPTIKSFQIITLPAHRGLFGGVDWVSRLSIEDTLIGINGCCPFCFADVLWTDTPLIPTSI